VSAARRVMASLIWAGAGLWLLGFALRMWSELASTVPLRVQPEDLLPDFAAEHLYEFVSALLIAGIALAAVSLTVRLCVRPGN